MVSRCFSQFIHYTPSLLLIPPHTLSSSCTFHLQHGVSPETVFHELLQCKTFPQDAVLQECFSTGSFYQRQSFRHTLLQHGSCLHRATGPNSISALAPETPSPLILHWPWCFQTCTSFTFSPFFVNTFLNVLSQSCSQQHCLAQLWPAAGPSWSRLPLTLSNTVSFCNLLTEVTLAALSPPLSKTCHINSTHTEMQTKYLWVLLKEVKCFLPSWEQYSSRGPGCPFLEGLSYSYLWQGLEIHRRVRQCCMDFLLIVTSWKTRMVFEYKKDWVRF